jgi:hypothetical protein
LAGLIAFDQGRWDQPLAEATERGALFTPDAVNRLIKRINDTLLANLTA